MLTAKTFSLSKVWEVIIPPHFPEVLFVIIICVLLSISFPFNDKKAVISAAVKVEGRSVILVSLCLFWQLLENASSLDVFRALSVIKQSRD